MLLTPLFGVIHHGTSVCLITPSQFHRTFQSKLFWMYQHFFGLLIWWTRFIVLGANMKELWQVKCVVIVLNIAWVRDSRLLRCPSSVSVSCVTSVFGPPDYANIWMELPNSSLSCLKLSLKGLYIWRFVSLDCYCYYYCAAIKFDRNASGIRHTNFDMIW